MDGKQVLEKGYAKINLALDVLGKREDGYHEVDMVMQTVSLCDDVLIEQRDGEADCLSIAYEDDRLAALMGADSENLCLKAAEAYRNAAGTGGGYKIHLKKRIPVAAGLAGGSADAAAVLRGMNRLHGGIFSMEQLEEIALGLGADVPYCIRGGTVRCRGIGEQMERLPDLPGFWVVLAKPGAGLSTKEIYAAIDHGTSSFGGNIDEMVEGIRLLDGGFDKDGEGRIWKNVKNIMEMISAGRIQEIALLSNQMRMEGAKAAAMSGSGSTVFGIFPDEAAARQAAEHFRQDPVGTTTVFVVQMIGGRKA